jgi:hypothetical protein
MGENISCDEHETLPDKQETGPGHERVMPSPRAAVAQQFPSWAITPVKSEKNGCAPGCSEVAVPVSMILQWLYVRNQT